MITSILVFKWQIFLCKLGLCEANTFTYKQKMNCEAVSSHDKGMVI